MAVNAGLSDAEFQKFSDIIYKHAGIFLKPEKKELLNARLSKRLRACQIPSFQKYFEFISSPGQKDLEFVHFLNAVSTNFTSFFREVSHFDYLCSSVMPSLIANDSSSGRRELIFWSAASSSGEEPYTLAMVLDDHLAKTAVQKVRILATDISTKVLQTAVSGVYSMEQIDKVPKEFLKRYFQKGVGKSAGKVKIKKSVREMVTFQRFNLMHDFPWRDEMDVIFCRNVMIYFDRETQQRLVQKFYQCLRAGGYLFIGHSESISSLKHDLKQVGATTYRKL
jgi:chemotaxis protein methyltransferase CheR